MSHVTPPAASASATHAAVAGCLLAVAVCDLWCCSPLYPIALLAVAHVSLVARSAPTPPAEHVAVALVAFVATLAFQVVVAARQRLRRRAASTPPGARVPASAPAGADVAAHPIERCAELSLLLAVWLFIGPRHARPALAAHAALRCFYAAAASTSAATPGGRALLVIVLVLVLAEDFATSNLAVSALEMGGIVLVGVVGVVAVCFPAAAAAAAAAASTTRPHDKQRSV
jgi:hypothetical protein